MVDHIVRFFMRFDEVLLYWTSSRIPTPLGNRGFPLSYFSWNRTVNFLPINSSGCSQYSSHAARRSLSPPSALQVNVKSVWGTCKIQIRHPSFLLFSEHSAPTMRNSSS